MAKRCLFVEIAILRQQDLQPPLQVLLEKRLQLAFHGFDVVRPDLEFQCRHLAPLARRYFEQRKMDLLVFEYVVFVDIWRLGVPPGAIAIHQRAEAQVVVGDIVGLVTIGGYYRLDNNRVFIDFGSRIDAGYGRHALIEMGRWFAALEISAREPAIANDIRQIQFGILDHRHRRRGVIRQAGRAAAEQAQQNCRQQESARQAQSGVTKHRYSRISAISRAARMPER